MNIAMIVYVLGWVTCFSGVFLLPSCLVALVYQESEGFVYLAAAVLYILLGLLITRRRPKDSHFFAQDGYAAAALTWMLISILGALPFYWCGDIPSLIDAVFETASGFSTTGSTILPDVEALSHASGFWRCFTHWLGGMGILVLVMAILPLSGGKNIHLMRAESPGPSVEKMVPKIRETARWLYVIYTAMTLIQLVLLLLGGMPFFEAITTCFSTAGTGGFAVLNSNMSGYSPYLQYVVGIFMLLFGINFNVYFLLVMGKFRAGLLYEEMHGYLLVIAVATALVTWDIRDLYPTFEAAFRHGFFQVSSVITTTGFMTQDFNLWPAMAQTVLVGIMFIGACAGSTGGGIKVSRCQIIAKFIRSELKRMRHPRVINQFRLNGSPVTPELLRSVLAFLASYLAVFCVSLLLVTFDGYDLLTNFTAVATTINNVGPGLSLVGPVCNFGFYSPFAKLVFTFDMLAGRLEIFPLLILFSSLGEAVSHRMRTLRRAD